MEEPTSFPVWQSSAVRVLRRHGTQQYFTGEGWTENPANAQAFPNDQDAVRACVAHGLQHMELVLRMPGGGPELSATPITMPGLGQGRGRLGGGSRASTAG